MKVYWQDPEKKVLVREFSKEWEWVDFQASVLTMRQMLAEVKHDVVIILDCRKVQVIPRGALGYFSEANQNLPPYVTARFLVSQNRLLHALYAVLERTVPENFTHFYRVSNMETACRQIHQLETITI